LAVPESERAARGAAGIAAGLGFAAMGFVTAPVAAVVSRMCWRTSAVTVPYGLLLSAAASLGVVLLARAVSRGVAAAAAAGWLVALGFVVNGTSGGGFLVASDALGWAFLILDCTVVLGAAAIRGVRR
jgi:hypothetical protein